MRTQFQRILRRAGLKPWQKLFHNLRASRESELMRSYDLATVCRWIGNSPEVAAKHYAVSVDLNADFRIAAGLEIKDKGAEEKAAQKAAQHAAELLRKQPHAAQESSICEGLRGGAEPNESLMGPRGVEPLTSSLSATRSNQLSYEPFWGDPPSYG